MFDEDMAPGTAPQIEAPEPPPCGAQKLVSVSSFVKTALETLLTPYFDNGAEGEHFLIMKADYEKKRGNERSRVV